MLVIIGIILVLSAQAEVMRRRSPQSRQGKRSLRAGGGDAVREDVVHREDAFSPRRRR